MIGLHGSDDAPSVEAENLFRRCYLCVLDAKAKILLLDAGECRAASSNAFSAISTARSPMAWKADLKPGSNAIFRHLVELCLIVLWESRIAGVVGVRLQQCCRSRTERTVEEALEHAGMKHRVMRVMMCSTLLQDFQRRVEWQPFGDANGQLVLVLQLLVYKEVIPAGIVLDTCQTRTGSFR